MTPLAELSPARRASCVEGRGEERLRGGQGGAAAEDLMPKLGHALVGLSAGGGDARRGSAAGDVPRGRDGGHVGAHTLRAEERRGGPQVLERQVGEVAA